jgi:hypothetical protein
MTTIPFTRAGGSGSIHVTVERVVDPAAVGQTSEARDFPCVTARVDYPHRGYAALFGWVQSVRSTDGPTGGRSWETDPFSLFSDSQPPSPYCFFGVSPTLFDSPARHVRKPMSWLAHTFLAWTPLDTDERRVVPLVGFSWGFDIDEAGTITIADANQLSLADWDTHLPFLDRSHPGWQFDRKPTTA